MIGARIKIVMDLLKLKRSEVAKELGVDPSMISLYRSGRSKPAYSIMTKFCKAYHVNMDWFVKGEGEVFNHKEIERLNKAKKVLRLLAYIKIEYRITQGQIEKELGLWKGFFTDLKKGNIEMPPDKINELKKYYKLS